MPRLGGLAAFALTTALAFDNGGFAPVSWNRALVVVAAASLLLVLLKGAQRPGGPALALLGALALLTVWTAASWFWSESPAAAPLEAQRTALYLVVAAAVVLLGRRVPPPALAGGVAAGATLAAVFNLAVRLAPDWTGVGPLRTDIGRLADPVGYANSLALLAAIGLLLALGLRGAAPALVPLAAAIALQDSRGTLLALGAGLVVYVRLAGLRALGLLVLPAIGAALVARDDAVVSPDPSNLLAAAPHGHRLLLALALLTAAQAALLRLRLPEGPRLPAAAALLVLAALAAALVVGLRGDVRTDYWRVALHEARANPVLGSGAGTYVDWWLRLRPEPRSTVEAHSLYAETLAELGPVGLALLLAALAVPLAAAWRLRSPPLAAALAAYAVGAAVDFHWELAAVTAPVVLLGASAAVHAAPARGPVRRRALVPALAAAVLAGVLALAGNAAIARGDGATAVRYAPFSAEAWKLRGDYRRALELDPNDWTAWVALAERSSGEARASALAEARRLNPLGGGP